MPNGFYGSREEWERMEAPLFEIDEFIAEFAARRSLRVVKNYHNWPQRQIDWTSDGIFRSIWILLANESTMTFHVAVLASQDKDADRYLKDHWLQKDASWDEVKNHLPQLLEDGYSLLESWREDDLMPAGQSRARE